MDNHDSDWWMKYEVPIAVPPDSDIQMIEKWEWSGNHKIATYQVYDYADCSWRSIYVVSDGTIESIDFHENFIGSIPFLEVKGRIVQHVREFELLEG